MSISNTVKTVMPYLKTAGEYVLHKLSSQAVEMNDGTTLEQKVTSLISLINQKLNVSKVINNLLTTEAGFALDARQGKALNDKITKLNGDLNTYLLLKSKSVTKSVSNISYWTVTFSADAVSGYTPIMALDNGNNGAYHYQSAAPAQLPSGKSFEFRYGNMQNKAITASIIHRYIVVYKKNVG